MTQTDTHGETMAKYAGPDNQTLLNKYLSFIANNPKVRDVLQKAVDVEENDPQKRQYGWEWHDVNAYPATMMKLVVGEGSLESFPSPTGTPCICSSTGRR